MSDWGRNGQPLVIAHRGASVAALENTLEAFRAARGEGADGVELDAMLTADGEVVVFHDDDLVRLGAGRKERIGALPLAALREVELSGKYGRGGISTLDEVLDEVPAPMLVNVELKTPGDARAEGAVGFRLAEATARLLSRRGDVGRFLVSSFNPLALGRFRVAAPRVRSGLLFAKDQYWPLRAAVARKAIRPTAMHPDRLLVDVLNMRQWRAEGYAVNVWTVDGADEVRRVAGLGVDGIITNRPRETRGFLG